MFITYYYDYDYSEGVTSFGSTPNDGARKYQYDDDAIEDDISDYLGCTPEEASAIAEGEAAADGTTFDDLKDDGDFMSFVLERCADNAKADCSSYHPGHDGIYD